MGSIIKTMLAATVAIGAVGLLPASAKDEKSRDASVSLSVSVGDQNEYGYGDRYDDRRYRDRDRYDRDRYDRDRYDRDRHGRDGRVVKREVYDTRYRARIVLVEEVFYHRRGRDYVCTLDVRGPEARYVPRGQVRAIANRECSRRARIRYV
jgi:hypothetical protein